MQQERIFIGLWRHGGWSVYPVEDITDDDLLNVNVLRELRATIVIGRDQQLASRQLARDVQQGVDPFGALAVDGHECRGLERVRDHVRRARSRPPPSNDDD